MYYLYPLNKLKICFQSESQKNITIMFLEGYPLEAKTAPKNWRLIVEFSYDGFNLKLLLCFSFQTCKQLVRNFFVSPVKFI